MVTLKNKSIFTWIILPMVVLLVQCMLLTKPYLKQIITNVFFTGLIASICLPVRIQDVLKGVVCVDQSFGELLSELTFFQIGESSYSFMVDHTTRVLQHPYMENPTFVTNTPAFTYLDSLEVGNGVDSMIQDILK